MVQVGALFHLAAHDGCLHKELAEALGVQPAGVSTLVDRMTTGGLVQRRTCSLDARAQRLHVTAAGKRVAARAQPIVAEMQAALVEGFSETEIAIVARFLASAATREFTPEEESK